MLIMIAGMIIFIGFSKIAPKICSKILVALKETYIIGYYLQRKDLYNKKNTEEINK